MKKLNLAEAYIYKVLSGEIIVGVTIKQAVNRHLDDLEHAKERGLYFDKKTATLALKAIQLIPHTSGKWAGQPFQLQGWQAFIIWCVYGWKIEETGLRRFKKAYIKVPRKNGKTEFLAAIGCLDLSLFAIEGGGLYWAATKRDQAKLGWERQKAMINKLKAKDRWFDKNFVVRQKRIVNKLARMFVDTLGRDSKTEDGHLVYRAYIDELHAHPDDGIVNILESGMGAFDEPLSWLITTAGFNTASYCKDFEDTCKDVLKGEKGNDGLFIMIFDVDEGDDWEDERTWAKANPGYGISPTKGFMFQEYQNAKMEGASKRISFLTKNLNIWTSSGSTWIAPEVWHASGKDVGLMPEELIGKVAYGGMDLAYSEDLTAFVLMFPLEEHFAILPFFWIPEAKARERAKRDGVKYLKWIEQGLIRTTEGDVTDYDVIREDILQICEMYDVKAINYDPWNSRHIVNQLMEAEAPMFPFQQTARNFHGPMFEFELRVKDKKIIHFDNEVLAWQMQNVELFFDSSGNMKVNKKSSKEKVDGVVSMAMCFGAWLSLKKEKKSIYSERGVRTL